MHLIDTHCHLDMSAYKHDLESVLANAQEKGVSTIITIGIDIKSSQKAVSLARQHKNIFATVGIHPHEATHCNDDMLHQLSDLGKDSKVVGYGEIGLDYAKKYSPPDVQQDVFYKQLLLAKKLKKPVIIHDRDAHKDTLKLLRKAGDFPQGGVMHCFSGNVKLAQQVIELGFMISIPGVVTFKNAKELQKVVKNIDIQHILVETDGPFLAPVPFRGKRNTPDKLLYTAKKIAEIKNISLEQVANKTTANAIKLFKLPEL